MIRATIRSWLYRVRVWKCSHRWGDPFPMVVCGPIDVRPEERVYTVLGFGRQCELCHHIEDVEPEPGAVDEAISEARQEDLAEWDDPVARAEYLEWIGRAEQITDEWLNREEWK